MTKDIIVIRHGALENPRGIAYNRDSSMKPEDIMHLSAHGREQLEVLALKLSDNGVHPKMIWSSPQTRAQESAEILRIGLDTPPVKVEPGIDEIFGPGAYLEGISLADALAVDKDRAEEISRKYGHENSKDVTARMLETVDNLLTLLTDGEIAAIVSHGDPIAYLLHYLRYGSVAEPNELVAGEYPEKGSAVRLSYDEQGKLVGISSILTKVGH